MNNKKVAVRLLLALCFLVIFTGNVFAEFDAFYMVDSYGSTNQMTTFTWEETPWIYVKLPTAGLNFEINWMNSPTNQNYGLSIMGSSQEFWISSQTGFNGILFKDENQNSVTWNPDMRELGLWDVQGQYFYTSGASGNGSTDFTVTPEPVSSTLFLVGAATLGFRYVRRTKKA